MTGLALDAAAAEIAAALRAAGVRSLLLKGRSFEEWLYEPGEPRMYTDIDLLVAVRDLAAAGSVLEALGYRRKMRTGRDFDGLFEEVGSEHALQAPTHIDHARVWVRPSDNVAVDLHRTLIGVEGEGVDPWDVLAADTDSMLVAGTRVEILSEPGRALHVALHAVHRGDTDRPLIDLGRALVRVPTATWQAAAALARQLGAEGAFATGLRMHPAGVELAANLGLTTEQSVETAMFTKSAPYSAWTVNRLAQTKGLVPKLRIVSRRTFPEPEFMRVWYPIAHRGLGGLGLAYLQRLAWLATATAPAIRAWRTARRDA